MKPHLQSCTSPAFISISLILYDTYCTPTRAREKEPYFSVLSVPMKVFYIFSPPDCEFKVMRQILTMKQGYNKI